MKKSEYLKLKRESDEGRALLARMRDRPDPWNAEEERQYRQWARSMGLE